MSIDINKVVMAGDVLYSNSDTFIINWQLGVFCNYNCSYCWPGAHSNKYDYKKLSEYMLYIDQFVDIALENNLSNISITLLGGEVTTYKQFPELIRYIDKITDVEFELIIVTNLSPNKKYWERLLTSINNIKIRLIASYHHEHVDIDSFLDKFLFITNLYQHIVCGVSIVMCPNKIEQLKLAVDKIKQSGVKCMFSFENDGKNTISPLYTTDMVNYINDLADFSKFNPNHYQIVTKNERHLFPSSKYGMINGLHNFFGWNCIAGYESIIVDATGRVFKCWTDKKQIGNLKSGFKLEKTKCAVTCCTKQPDVGLKKWRSI
jgi:sulfatase maturation enzyme AslB (radical SAM superfamily)